MTPEGFTKEVVKLEDGDLNQWPQLSVRIENLLMASEKDGVVHVAVVYDATCVRLPLTPGWLTTVAHTTHMLLGSKVVAVVIRLCRADSDMIHRLVSIGCGNGPQTECWATTTFQKINGTLTRWIGRSAAICSGKRKSPNPQQHMRPSGIRAAKAKSGSARGPWLQLRLRPRTTASGARGWRAFAKPWGRSWGHTGKYTSNPATAASTSFAGRANPPPPIWSCWPRPFCGRAAKMATASANCSTAGPTANGSAHGEP